VSRRRATVILFCQRSKKGRLRTNLRYFLETAEQERAHAKVFFRFLEGGPVEITATYPAGKIGTTTENLLEAAEGEHEEWTELYEEFARVAEEEGFKQVASKFKLIKTVEKTPRGTLPQTAEKY